jgi:hypothetical protein
MRRTLSSTRFCQRALLPTLVLMLCYSTAVLGADTIRGSVRNQSLGEPAAGDNVILIRLDGKIREEAHTKTDGQGVFTLDTQSPDKPHLVRVIHEGVTYDRQVSSTAPLSLEVFDTAPRVRAIAGTIEILRTGTNGNLLHVSDMVEIVNSSTPPLTKADEHTLDVYLPPAAKIDSVLAAAPGNLAEVISAAPVSGEPGHFTLNFPLRPGASKFAFNYDLPYHGRVAFHARHAYPLQQLAVMTPAAMKFSSRSSAFEMLKTGIDRYQVHAATQLKAGDAPVFEVSGTGAMPPLGDQASSRRRFVSPASPHPTQSPPVRGILPSLASSDSPLKPPVSLPSQSLALGAVTLVLLAACAFLIWRGRKARSRLAVQTVAPRTG